MQLERTAWHWQSSRDPKSKTRDREEKKRDGVGVGGMNTIFKHKILGQVFAQLCHYGMFMIK